MSATDWHSGRPFRPPSYDKNGVWNWNEGGYVMDYYRGPDYYREPLEMLLRLESTHHEPPRPELPSPEPIVAEREEPKIDFVERWRNRILETDDQVRMNVEIYKSLVNRRGKGLARTINKVRRDACIYRVYRTHNLSAAQLAKLFDCNVNAVKKRIADAFAYDCLMQKACWARPFLLGTDGPLPPTINQYSKASDAKFNVR